MGSSGQAGDDNDEADDSTPAASSEPDSDTPSRPGGDDDGDGDDVEFPRRATNLRSFTRIGGRGYALPPTKRHPYMVSLQLEGHFGPDDKYDVHMCGGVLVAPDVVLTAAHCASYSPPGTDETYRAFNGIEIGKTDLADEGVPFDPYSSETYKLYYENLVPKKLHKHPDYDEDTYEHDIMLVKVFGKSRYPPVKLGEGSAEEERGSGSRLVALGWGADSANTEKKYSDKLKSAELDLMSNQKCRNIRVDVVDPVDNKKSVLSLRDHIFDDMMCASSDDRYICYGDAGGPAIYQGGNSDEDVVVGILSWGYGCVNRDYPAVMTKVPDHYGWIKRKICDMSSDPPEQYGCKKGGGITALSGVAKQRVTLKVKLDMMSVETGFVVEVRDTGEIVAQRQTGHYKSQGNEVVLEKMDLPMNQCYRLLMLDSYGDGFCCEMGGGSATMYRGTDTSYYDGDVLAEVNGNFEFDSGAEFCLNSPANTVVVVDNDSPPSPPSPVPPRTPRPTPPASPANNSNGSSGGSGGSGGSGSKGSGGSASGSNHNSNGSSGGSGSGSSGGSGGSASGSNQSNQSQSSAWSGPVTSPAWEYCNSFCTTSSHGMLCGNYECIHATDVVATDSQEGVGGDAVGNPPPPEEDVPVPKTDTQFYDGQSTYYLTIQFQFDENPEEISWVLYDLTSNEVKVFVDFDTYSKDEYANQMLYIIVTMNGPEDGEKEYAFTVYDKMSNGLCCAHGEGYYTVFLGDATDELELLGDAEFDFSSSYYFTLFEMEGMDAELVTPAPTTEPPTEEPTRRPTKFPTMEPTTRQPRNPPTNRPTRFPTGGPTNRPTTERPTEIWEKRRPETMDAIGARWNTRTNTPPGVFHDLGGDQGQFRIDLDGSVRNAAASSYCVSCRVLIGALVMACPLLLTILH